MAIDGFELRQGKSISGRIGSMTGGNRMVGMMYMKKYNVLLHGHVVDDLFMWNETTTQGFKTYHVEDRSGLTATGPTPEIALGRGVQKIKAARRELIR